MGGVVISGGWLVRGDACGLRLVSLVRWGLCGGWVLGHVRLAPRQFAKCDLNTNKIRFDHIIDGWAGASVQYVSVLRV